MKTKRCPKCKRFLSIEKFYIDRSRKDGLVWLCKNCIGQRDKEYRSKNRGLINRRKREYRLKIKIEVFGHYAGRPPKCACCDELHIEFLGIDHINGGGTKHRRKIGKGSSQIYRWLKRNNYPKGYRVLCNNCNSALGLFGYCPHKSNKILKGGH